jgi:hypothetical protein
VFPTTSQADVPFATVAPGSIITQPAPAKSPQTETPSVVPTSPDSNAADSPLSGKEKVGEWVDLLQWSQGVDWSPRGIDWNDNLAAPISPKKIRLKVAEYMRFPLPAIIIGNYELELEFNRTSGEQPVAISFPVGIHTLRLLLDEDHKGTSHVSYVNGRPYGNQRLTPIQNKQRQRLRIEVEHDGEQAGFRIDWNGAKDAFKWEGAYSSLKNYDESAWSTNMIQHVWIGTGNYVVDFQKLRVKMQSGSIQRDSFTAADREQDLKNGFVRLIHEKATAVSVGAWQFTVNQIPLIVGGKGAECDWPMITRQFKVCDSYYGAHAPSRLKCSIPAEAKSFSVIGYNDASRTVRYQVLIDHRPVFESGETGFAMIKVAIPEKSSLMELAVDSVGDAKYDDSYWCYPQFHSVPVDQLTDKMLDEQTGPLKFNVSDSKAEGPVTHNEPLQSRKSPPIHFRDLQPCHEFLYAHAPSSVTYEVPPGMTQFTAIGYNTRSHHAKFEVWADGKRLHETAEAGIVPIDVKLPVGTKVIQLQVTDLGDSWADHSIWCYPRLSRK